MKTRFMIRMLSVLTAIMMLIPFTAYCTEQAVQKKVTVMLYMCGSDLESRNGQGSRSVSDILNSGFDRDEVNVVALLGGAEQWKDGYDPEVLSLLSFENEQQATVAAEWEAAPMDSPETLTAFLDYCHEHYPAERYDLVIWDHGGGPNYGVCLDELYPGGWLSMTELIQALDESPFRDKGLDIICFDACLMGSAEVAACVAPYARYMVATEDSMYGSPAGWLKGIEDETSYDTACRWVDGCYEMNERLTQKNRSSVVVSVSLIELAYMDELGQATDGFFAEAVSNLNEESFTSVANLLRRATAFGVTESGGKSEYDLVDLGDLARQYHDLAPACADLVTDAVKKCVPYLRSSTDRSCGLTVYHPLMNKKASVEWIPAHSRLRFSEKYNEYILAFTAILTGTPLASWTKLVTLTASNVKDNRILFTLAMTEDQAAHFSSAGMNVLMKNEDGTYSFTFRTNSITTDKTTLTGDYNGTALYVVDRVGNPVTLPLIYTPVDWKTVQVPVTVHKNAAENQTGFDARAIVTCDYDAVSGRLIPGGVVLWDDRIGGYSAANNMAFSDYDSITLKTPSFRESRDGMGTLKALAEWDTVSEKEWRMDNDGSWSFRILHDTVDTSLLYASFEVTDSQMNRYSSELHPLRSKAAGPGSITIEYDDAGLVLISSLRPFTLQNRLLISVNVKNITGQECFISLDHLSVNGMAADTYAEAYGNGIHGGLDPDEEQIILAEIPASVLADIGTVSELLFQLNLKSTETEEKLGSVPVKATMRYTLPDPQ